MEYVRWHHYVPDKPLQGFVEPINGLIFIFCNYFSILQHCAMVWNLSISKFIKFIQFKTIFIVFIYLYVIKYFHSVMIFVEKMLHTLHGCQNALIYFHNIPLLEEIVFHEAPLHFHIITFHQVLEWSFSFGLHCLLWSKANLFQLFAQSKMQPF